MTETINSSPESSNSDDTLLLRLAENPDPFVRKTVLLNPKLPVAAYNIFAGDPDPVLREENAIILAKKVLNCEDREEPVPDWIVSVLTVCARDVVDSVRLGVSATLRACRCTPRALALLLARDKNASVSGPILRYSPILREVDCEEIITDPTITEDALGALAERSDLSPTLTTRIRDQQGRIRDLRLYQEGLQRALDHKKSSKLSDETVYEAAKAKDRFYVLGALSILSRKPPEHVQRIMASQSPMAILSLCWLSDLSARTAYQVQVHIAGILPRKALTPAEGGGYPFAERQMAWNAEFLDTLMTG